MTSKKKTSQKCECQEKQIHISEYDEGLLDITQNMFSHLGAVRKKHHVQISYNEVIEGQEFKLHLEFYATGGLLSIRGLLGTHIDISCADCVANLHALTNSLYVDSNVFYGRVHIQKASLEYNLTNYYPFSTNLELVVGTWRHFIPIVYKSVRKDITRFLTALKKMSEFTRINGCALPAPSNQTTH